MNFQAYTLSSRSDWACIQIKAPESETRTPVHLCCVIDTSISMMSENKLENVKQSLQFLLDFLGPQDSLSIITFSETAHTILTQTYISSSEKDNIHTRISIIKVESNTNLSAGIIQSRETLMIDTSNVKQGILLLTDGVANMGLTRSEDIIELTRNTITKFNGTSISSVGYGTDHNVELLQNISTEGGGSYYVVNNLEDVATVFGNILGGLVSCAAQQIRVILPAGTEIKSRYATNTVGDQMEIVIGDLTAGSEAAFLAKIPANTEVSLKGYDLTTHNTIEINTTINTTDDTSLQVSGEAHYIRFEVMSILEQSRSLMNYTTPVTDINIQITKIDDCITTISQHRAAHEHSLWDILLNELNECKRTLQNRNIYDTTTPQIMTQRAGYLGLMRGLPAGLVSRNVTGENTHDDPNNVAHPIPIGRTFSNFAQRQISSQLCATVSNNATQQAAYRSTTHDPIRAISHITAPLNYISNLPSPVGPLVRQVACTRSITGM